MNDCLLVLRETAALQQHLRIARLSFQQTGFIAQVHMAAGDHAGLIEACARLGDVSRGGDPHLWTEVLQYFGSQNYDCSAQVTHLISPMLRSLL